MKNPNFFIVGAPKCATSSLYSHLRMHPDIFLAHPKELNYFSSDIIIPDSIKDLKSYESLFTDADSQKAVGEASVWYMYSKVAAGRIKEYSPDARIIAMIRNPVDMIYSYHSQRLWNKTEDITDFREAISAIDDRKNGKRLPENPYPVKGLYYIDIARYHGQLRRYFDTFGEPKVHVIIFDDIKQNKDSVLTNALDFLGVESNSNIRIPDTGLTRNANKRTKSQTISRLLAHPPPIALKIARTLMPANNLRRQLIQKLRIMNTKWETRPAMDSSVQEELTSIYADEVEKLSELLKRDLVALWS